jgi:hypothetical protein
MRRFPTLLWLALLAVGLGRSSGTVLVTPPLAVRPGLEAVQDHALPATAILARGERARPGPAGTYAVPAGARALTVVGLRTIGSSKPAPTLRPAIAGALAYFPTGPPLLV